MKQGKQNQTRRRGKGNKIQHTHTRVHLARTICLLRGRLSTTFKVGVDSPPKLQQGGRTGKLEARMSAAGIAWGFKLVRRAKGDVDLLARCCHVEPGQCALLQRRHRARRQAQRVGVEFVRLGQGAGRDGEVDVREAGDQCLGL